MTAGLEPAGAGLNRLTATFRDPLQERRYRDSRRDADLRQAQVAILIGIVANLGFTLLDAAVLHEHVALALTIRVGIIPGGYLAVLLAMRTRWYRTRAPRLAAVTASIVTAWFTLAYAAICAVGAAPEVYLSGYVLLILPLLLFVPADFITISVVAVLGTVAFAALIPLSYDMPLGVLLTIYAQYAAAILIGMPLLYALETMRRQDFVNLQRVADERSRHQALLMRVLPHSIVERLEAGEETIADDVATATVLFADIVGFTQLSSRHPPAEIVAFLNRVFACFDDLAARFGVEKIKTIGDAYMVAAGLPAPRPDHVRAVADLALAMREAAAALRTPDGRALQLRIGIHTGAVTAGVIGETRFGYDLWGDTVNIASRMESLGAPGCIQVTDEVRAQLGDRYSYEPRGEIDVKGRGVMTLWLLVARNP